MKMPDPPVIFSFIVAAFGCAFAGMCYSEFATMIPIAGSAYTYAYATMGELLAWIIGWDLVLEYAVGAATVSVSWSKYLIRLLRNIRRFVSQGADTVPVRRRRRQPSRDLHHLAISIILIDRHFGIGASQRLDRGSEGGHCAACHRRLGFAYINHANYVPFVPPNTGQFGDFGWSGVMRAAGVIFFAYIGFDAVSTAAQETKKPHRDMPIGIIGSLAVCTILYVAFSYVLTGIVNYKNMTDTAIYEALHAIGYDWLGTGVVIGILAGYTSVILVMLLGQSRVFYSMSRDGLLPKLFSDIHPRFRTPWRCNLVFMVFVSLFSGLVPLSSLGDMVSIGTLLAFVIVCGGVMIMRRTNPDLPRPYRTPMVPLVPILGIIVCLAMMASLDIWTWLRLVVWLVIGLTVYFTYSRYHSRLVTEPEPAPANTQS